VEISAHGLAEGSRWRVQVVQEARSSGGDKQFRRVAVNGGWTVVTRFPASGGDMFTYVGARERGNRVHSCAVVTLSSPVYGLSECSNPRRVSALVVRELNDGSTVVRAFVGSARANSVWHLTLTATGTGSRQVVEFDGHAGNRGVVRSRVLLTGMEHPRLRLLATNKAGGRCFVGLDPPNVTTDAPLTLQGLRKLSASTR
jgi:hypothetical protein